MKSSTSTFFLFVVFVIILILIVCQFGVSSILAGQNDAITTLEQDISALTEQDQALNTSIDTLNANTTYISTVGNETQFSQSGSVQGNLYIQGLNVLQTLNDLKTQVTNYQGSGTFSSVVVNGDLSVIGLSTYNNLNIAGNLSGFFFKAGVGTKMNNVPAGYICRFGETPIGIPEALPEYFFVVFSSTSSLKNYGGNKGDYWIVNPGYLFVVFTDYSFSGTSYNLDNTDGYVPRGFDTSQGNYGTNSLHNLSLKVYYLGNLVNIFPEANQ